MKDIELLSDPDIRHDSKKYQQRCVMLGHMPFQNAISVETNAPMDFPTLFTYKDEPYLGMAQRGKIITIINLTPLEEDEDDPNGEKSAGKIMSVQCLDEADLVGHVSRVLLFRRHFVDVRLCRSTPSWPYDHYQTRKKSSWFDPLEHQMTWSSISWKYTICRQCLASTSSSALGEVVSKWT